MLRVGQNAQLARRTACDILLDTATRAFPGGLLSGRSAAWLARLVRDQEVEGSNPFAPTTSKWSPSAQLTLSFRGLSFRVESRQVGRFPVAGLVSSKHKTHLVGPLFAPRRTRAYLGPV